MSKTELMSESNEVLYRLHFKKVFRAAVALADVRRGEKVLDFGCGTKHLKRELPEFVHQIGPQTRLVMKVHSHYLGYDVNPERSDVESFTDFSFDIIFAINVLEHLSEGELKETFAKFRKTGARKLVVSLPAENTLFNFFSFFTKGNSNCFWYHKTPAKRVADLLLEEFGFPEKIKRVDGMKYLARFNVELLPKEAEAVR